MSWLGRCELGSAYRRDLCELLPELLLGKVKVVTALQIDPDIGTVPEQLAEAQGHSWRNRLPFTQDIEQRLTGNAEQAGDFGLAFAQRRKDLLTKHFPGMHGPQPLQKRIHCHQW